MIIDRTHIKWGTLTAVATCILGIIYMSVIEKGEISNESGFTRSHLFDSVGSTPLGLTYGIIAFLIFIFAGLLAWRRKNPALRVGRLVHWLKAHIWLSILTIPLILMHSGFHFGGPMTSTLMWLYIIVMASGFLGLGLQNIIPKMMKDKFPDEVVFEQIPFLRERIAERVKEIKEEIVNPKPVKKKPVKAGEGGAEENDEEEAPAPLPQALINFIDQDATPYLESTNCKGQSMNSQPLADEIIRSVRVQTDENWHSTLANIQELIDERRLLDKQAHYQHILHGWLIVHGPISFVLIAITIWHIVVTLTGY